MIFKLNEMFELVNLGYLVFQKHPVHDLYIFNYSKKTQFESYWNEITLASRGLVLNSKNKLVARCLPKFFNYQEVPKEKIPTGPFKVYEKLDGSYLQIFKYNDDLIFSSRGSFTSDQAIKAKEIFEKKYSHLADKMEIGINYIFEVIYPTNRIVVDYGDKEDLIMLTTINASTREDKLIDIGFPMVKEYDYTDFETIVNMHIDNHEGFVLRWPDDRFKSKMKDYVRLHRVLTNCSNRDIWNILKVNGTLDEVLEKVPDEFYDWVRDTEISLRANYTKIENHCLTVFKPLQLLLFLRNLNQIENKDSILTTKQAALFINKEKKYRSVLYNMYKGMNYSTLIWDMVEPKWEKPFSKKYDIDEQ